jgi:hypothetical protein
VTLAAWWVRKAERRIQAPVDVERRSLVVLADHQHRHLTRCREAGDEPPLAGPGEVHAADALCNVTRQSVLRRPAAPLRQVQLNQRNPPADVRPQASDVLLGDVRSKDVEGSGQLVCGRCT